MTFNLQSDRKEEKSMAGDTYLQAGGAIMDTDPGGVDWIDRVEALCLEILKMDEIQYNSVITQLMQSDLPGLSAFLSFLIVDSKKIVT